MEKECYILTLSGGKDSTALALFIMDNMPELHEKIEYVFYDTGLDLPETYDYLNKIEVFLDKKITYVKPEKSFDHIFSTTGMLPNMFARWCTVELKVKPSVKFFKRKILEEGYEKIHLYAGIRADESYRDGVVLNSEFEKKHVIVHYPLIENNFNLSDVEDILIESGLNYPDYYNWRKRNGCYLCFFQSPIDWIHLYENHPDYFMKAVKYEKEAKQGKKHRFGFNLKMPLEEMIKPENMKKIKEKYEKKENRSRAKKSCKLIDMAEPD